MLLICYYCISMLPMIQMFAQLRGFHASFHSSTFFMYQSPYLFSVNQFSTIHIFPLSGLGEDCITFRLI